MSEKQSPKYLSSLVAWGKKNSTELQITGLIVVLAIIAYVILHKKKMSKWKCSGGSCIPSDKSYDFDTKADCESKCSNKPSPTISCTPSPIKGTNYVSNEGNVTGTLTIQGNSLLINVNVKGTPIQETLPLQLVYGEGACRLTAYDLSKLYQALPDSTLAYLISEDKMYIRDNKDTIYYFTPAH
ncbi:MAG: hypothetical protein CMI56_00835 [Parcubacteria group bacterium]|nr:hypothetical protein [Parcubacteria group bacterium]|tara:strand:- start:2406 stop:2957 length:552 start_codon:yes stop_codon:yes gene_type:complete